jgi:hypothetical protein
MRKTIILCGVVGFGFCGVTGTTGQQPASSPTDNGGTSSSRPTNSQQVPAAPATSPSQSTPMPSPEQRPSSPSSSTITPTAQPTASATVTTSPTGTPHNAVTPQSPANADNERPKVGGRFKSQAQRFHPRVVEPMPAPSPHPSGSPSSQPVTTPVVDASATTSPESPTVRQRPPGLRRRATTHPGLQPGSPVPSPASSPSAPSSTASPTP